MSARYQLLKSITTNKPASVDLPVMDIQQVISYDDNATQFKKILESIGGSVVELNSFEELRQEIEKEESTGNFIVNTIAELGSIDENLKNLSSRQLESVHKVFIRGTV